MTTATTNRELRIYILRSSKFLRWKWFDAGLKVKVVMSLLNFRNMWVQALTAGVAVGSLGIFVLLKKLGILYRLFHQVTTYIWSYFYQILYYRSFPGSLDSKPYRIFRDSSCCFVLSTWLVFCFFAWFCWQCFIRRWNELKPKLYSHAFVLKSLQSNCSK